MESFTYRFLFRCIVISGSGSSFINKTKPKKHKTPNNHSAVVVFPYKINFLYLDKFELCSTAVQAVLQLSFCDVIGGRRRLAVSGVVLRREM